MVSPPPDRPTHLKPYNGTCQPEPATISKGATLIFKRGQSASQWMERGQYPLAAYIPSRPGGRRVRPDEREGEMPAAAFRARGSPPQEAA